MSVFFLRDQTSIGFVVHFVIQVFRMIVVNTETIPGYSIQESKGLVQGNTIRAKHMGRDIAASLKNLVGGELKGYTEMLTEARREALERMLSQAEELGADAVVNLRFSTSAVTQGGAEIYAYGTAVVAEEIEETEDPPADESIPSTP